MLQGGTKVTAYFRVTLTVSSFPLKITDPLFLLVDCNKEEDKKDWYPLRQLQTQRVGALRAPCPSYSKDVLSLTFYAYLGLSIPSGGVALSVGVSRNAAFVCVKNSVRSFVGFKCGRKRSESTFFVLRGSCYLHRAVECFKPFAYGCLSCLISPAGSLSVDRLLIMWRDLHRFTFFPLLLFYVTKRILWRNGPGII